MIQEVLKISVRFLPYGDFPFSLNPEFHLFHEIHIFDAVPSGFFLKGLSGVFSVTSFGRGAPEYFDLIQKFRYFRMT